MKRINYFNEYRREEQMSPSFMEQMEFVKKKDNPNPGEGGAGGAGGAGGDNKDDKGGAPDLKQVETDTNTYTALMEKGEVNLNEAEKKTLAELRGKYDFKQVDEEGKELSPEAIKAEEEKQRKIATIQAKPANQRTLEEIKFLDENVEKQRSLYEEVDELSGIPVQVDYGDLDPSSPEGVVKRESVVRESAIAAFEAQLKEEYPLAYQFLLHSQAGGSPETFFSTNNEDWAKVSVTKEDKASQEKIYRKALELKGTAQDQIDLFVQVAKDKGKLFEFSSSELEQLQRAQKAEQLQRDQQSVQLKQHETQVRNEFYNALDGYLKNGVNGVSIPVADRKGFMEFVGNNIFMDQGKLIYVRPVELKELEGELAAQYFKFKKGDLSNIVLNKAKSLKAEEKKKAIKLVAVPRSSSGAAPKQKVSMSEV